MLGGIMLFGACELFINNLLIYSYIEDVILERGLQHLCVLNVLKEDGFEEWLESLFIEIM
jgi:hypothetical protein